MIKEAYVSFEVAKLLKEKGFDIPCYGRYSVRSQEFHLDTTKPCNNGGISQYSAPTHQVAMGWLREVHNIVIVVTPSMFWGKYNVSVYKGNDYPIGFDGDSLISSYEQACETAIKYCLESLI